MLSLLLPNPAETAESPDWPPIRETAAFSLPRVRELLPRRDHEVGHTVVLPPVSE
jgi:hypothetical protein